MSETTTKRSEFEGFTAGPWFVAEDEQFAPGTLCVAALPKHRQQGTRGNGCCVCRVAPPEFTTETDRANAALIAAAPRLLAERDILASMLKRYVKSIRENTLVAGRGCREEGTRLYRDTCALLAEIGGGE